MTDGCMCLEDYRKFLIECWQNQIVNPRFMDARFISMSNVVPFASTTVNLGTAMGLLPGITWFVGIVQCNTSNLVAVDSGFVRATNSKTTFVGVDAIEGWNYAVLPGAAISGPNPWYVKSGVVVADTIVATQTTTSAASITVNLTGLLIISK